METSQEKVVGEEPTVEPAVPVATPEAVVTPTAAVEEAPQKKQTTAIVASLIAGALLILGSGYYVYNEYYMGGGTVAVVNGAKIYQSELDENIALLKQDPSLYGIDPAGATADKQIQDQALDALITQMLFITAAQSAGFTVDAEKVETLYSELATNLGGEEALKTQMAAVGLTDEKLRRNIRERELINQYLEAETPIEEVSVTEEEVAEFVTMLTENGAFGSENGKNIEPNLEEIRSDVEAEIKGQKQQQLISELLVKLREEATIEVKI